MMEYRQLTDDEKRRAATLSGHLVAYAYQHEVDACVVIAASVLLVAVLSRAHCGDPSGQLELIADHLMDEAAKLRGGDKTFGYPPNHGGR